MRLKVIFEIVLPNLTAPRARSHGFVGSPYILSENRLKERNEEILPPCDEVGNFDTHIDNCGAPLSGTVPVLPHPVSYSWL